MQRGPEHLISSCSFVKESSFVKEEHGFYGALLCALLRRGKNQGEILQIREGTEVSEASGMR